MTNATNTPDWFALLEMAKGLGLEYATNGIDGGEFRPTDSPLSGEWSDGMTPREILPMIAKDQGFTLEGYAPLEDWEIEQLADSWEDGYNSAEWPVFGGSFGEIVGYVYLASEYSPAQLHAAYVERWIRGGACSPAARDMGMEDILNQRAAAEGIDRGDEYTFDSDDFPKVILGE